MSSTITNPSWKIPGSEDNIVSRMERIPITSWQIKARLLIGTGTFFDAFDALAIGQVLPTLIRQWHLTPSEIGTLIAIGYLGQLFGALIFSQLAERRGRLVGISAAICTFTLFSLGTVFANTYALFMLFRFLQGLGLGGEVPIGAVYINEITKAKGRGRFVLLFELVFSVGVVAAALIGRWIVPNLGWHYMYIIGTLPIIIVPAILAWLPESPRWLAQQQRAAEADSAMSRIEKSVAAAFKKPLPEPREVTHKTVTKKSRISELLSGEYRIRTLTVWVIWAATYLVYYGIGTWLPSLYEKQFHVTPQEALTYGMIGNACAFLGAAICAFTIDLVGRRTMFLGSLIGSGLMLIILAGTGVTHVYDLAIWGSLAWMFAGASSIGLYLYTPEIYPTRMRSIGVGAATAWLRLASMCGPLLIGTLIAYGLPMIFTVFAIVSILGAVVVFFFAIETKDRVLEEISQ